MNRNPKISFPFSLLLDHTPSYLWPLTHHSCIGQVQASGVWALCVLQFCVCPKLVHYSCICHGLKACLCILPLITSYGVDCFLISHFLTACFSQGLGLAWLWAFISSAYFFAPSVVLLPFLPCYSTIPVMVSFDPSLLGLF